MCVDHKWYDNCCVGQIDRYILGHAARFDMIWELDDVRTIEWGRIDQAKGRPHFLVRKVSR